MTERADFAAARGVSFSIVIDLFRASSFLVFTDVDAVGIVTSPGGTILTEAVFFVLFGGDLGAYRESTDIPDIA
jgi:hypothetical protein